MIIGVLEQKSNLKAISEWPQIVWPTQPTKLASVATCIEKHIWQRPKAELNLRRGKSFQKDILLRAFKTNHDSTIQVTNIIKNTEGLSNQDPYANIIFPIRRGFKEVSYMCTLLYQENVFKAMLVENDWIFLITRLLAARATNIQLKCFVEPRHNWWCMIDTIEIAFRKSRKSVFLILIL
jgi:hypothetical protein